MNIDPKYYIFAAGVIIFAFIGYFVGAAKTSEDVVGQLTANIQGQIDIQYKERLSVLQKTLDDRNKEIAESRLREKSLLGTLDKLQRKKEDVKLPTSNEELDSRINALGLKPVIR